MGNAAENTTAQSPESSVSVSSESEALIALATVINYLEGETLAAEASSVGMEAIRQKAIYGLTGENYGSTASDNPFTQWVTSSIPKKKQVEAVADIALRAIDILEGEGTEWEVIDDPAAS